MGKQKHKWLLVALIPLIAVLLLGILLLVQMNTKYTVSFYDMDGTLLESESYKRGENFVVPETPVKEGHTFSGWNLEGQEGLYDFLADQALVVQGNMKFTACFDVYDCVVKFMDANGIDVISSKNYRYGEEITVPEDPQKSGHSFVGWVRTGESAVYNFDADGAKKAKDGMTFTAKFDANKYKIVFMDADGNEYKAFTLRYGDSFVAPDKIERAGYVFRGWALTGETEPYDFTAANATKVTDKDFVFVPLYTKLSTVAGKFVTINGSGLPANVTIVFDDTEKNVAVGADGTFTTQILAGTYSFKVKLDGYKALCNDLTIKSGANNIGEIKLIQSLSKDFTWWDGATIREDGASVTISTASGVHAESATEYKIGTSIADSSSWRVTSHIEAGANGIVGFSVGRNDGKNGTVFIYVNTANGKCGFFTWDTFEYSGNSLAISNFGKKGSGTMSDAVQAALKSANGYKLTLTATNIDGEGTGWLTLYVNDTPVLTMEASKFEGVLSGGKGVDGQKMNLANSHLSLVVMGEQATATFKDYYYVLDVEEELKFGTVTGTCEKVDKTEGFPETLMLQSGSIYQEVSVATDGTFSAKLPAGTYALTGKLDGYKIVCDEFTVTDGQTTKVTAKLLQNLVQDYKWWDGATKTENGTSVTLCTLDGAHGESATEYRVGKPITSADSWKVSAHIEAGTTGIVGFSVGRNDGKNGTVYFYINKANGNYGFFTWDTFTYYGTPYGINNYGKKGSGTSSEAVKAMLNSADGFDLTLTAANIDGEGTGWLTLYVNDTAVLTMYNNFVGVESGGKGVNGQRMDLGNAHLSLAAMGTNISATFTDYYYTVNSEDAIKAGTVNGRLEKVDKTALSADMTTALLQFGDEYRLVDVAADGTFHAQLPAGEHTVAGTVDGYRAGSDKFTIADGQSTEVTVKLLQTLTQDYKWWDGTSKTESGSSVIFETASDAHANSATEYKLGDSIADADSWKITSHIEAGATGIVGFSVGRDDGNNGTVYIYVNKNNGGCGFYTWSTYKYSGKVNGITIWDPGVNGSGVMSDEAKAMLDSADGFDLTLTAANIDGEGTGWLTLYVNDIAVLTMYNNFVGVESGGKGVNGQRMDLGNAHLSLAAMGTNISATFTDYYYTVNSEDAIKAGTVNGKLEKVDKTALSADMTTALLQFGNEYRLVDVAADGTFHAQLLAGEHTVAGTVDGYRAGSDKFIIADGQSTEVTVKLLQTLTDDTKWNGGSTKTESGSSVTVTTASGVNAQSTTEYKIGSSVKEAVSWKVTSHIEAGATGIIGFSVGRDDGNNGTVYIYVNKNNGGCGFYTWGTYKYSGKVNGITIWDPGANGSGAMSTEVQAMLNSDEGFDLTLTAANIDGEGTGWLTLYVNDTAVLTMYNNFVGVESGGKGVNGQRMDLGNAHLSLAAMGTNISATFTDYYYTVNSEDAIKAGTVNGQLVKLDGTTLPATALLQFGDEYRLVDVADDGTFCAQLPEGTYELTYTLDGYRTICDSFTVTNGQTTDVTVKLLQTLTQDYKWWNGTSKTESGSSVIFETASDAHANSATEYKLGNSLSGAASWELGAHIEAGATGIIGFSVGRDDGNNGTVYFYVNKTNGGCGFYTWSTFKYSGTVPNITVWGANGSGTMSTEVQAMLNSADGFDLTLKATNINGEGTGTLTLYVNETAVLTMDASLFTGALESNKGVNGQKLDLANSHLSLALMGTNKSATYTDYYLTKSVD